MLAATLYATQARLQTATPLSMKVSLIQRDKVAYLRDKFRRRQGFGAYATTRQPPVLATKLWLGGLERAAKACFSGFLVSGSAEENNRTVTAAETAWWVRTRTMS